MDSGLGSSKVVPWSSLFWGLVPFAINSMTQPAGLVCGADADVGFLLRSSPIICITDALLVLIYLAFHRSIKSFQDAQDKLIRRRFQSDIYVGFKRSKRDGLKILRSNEQYFRVVVFALTLSQFVKIFAFEGIIWTKVIAALYLGSFLIIEALVVWPVANKKDIEDGEESKSSIIIYASVALAVAFMLYFASIACRDVFGQPHHTLPQWSATVIGSLGTIMATPALGYCFHHARTWKQIRVSAILLLFVLGAPVGFYFTGRIIRDTTPAIWVQFISAMLSIVWGGIGFLYASETTKVIRQPDKVQQRKKVEQVTAWYFFILHLTTPLLYFLFSYDAAGTVKPLWTDYLG